MSTKSDQIRNTITKITTLPTLAHIAATVAKLFQNSSMSAAEAGETISHDQVLAAKTLKLANSAYFGFPSQISSVTQAIVMLGFNRVRELALTATIVKTFSGTAKKLDLKLLWEHSIVTAIATELLGERLMPQHAQNAFSAGLLHDIGSLVLAVHMSDDFEHVLEFAAKNNLSMREAEQQLLGSDHGVIGAQLCERWNFPKPLTQAIMYHHTPTSLTVGWELAALTCVGDLLAQATLIGTGADTRVPKVDTRVVGMIKLDVKDLDSILKQLFERIGEARPFFEMLE